MKTLFLQQKKSGNFTITSYLDNNWKLIATCNSPKELKEAVNSLPNYSEIIKSEYSKSQLKCYASRYNEKDALRAFELSANKINLEKYFK